MTSPVWTLEPAGGWNQLEQIDLSYNDTDILIAHAAECIFGVRVQ